MAEKGGKGKKDAQPKKESKSSGDVVVNVGESKSNEGLLEKDKRGRCDCRLPFTSRGDPKASPPLSDAPQKNLETSWFTYILWIVLPLLAAGVVGYALYLAIHIANAPQPANHIVQPQTHQGQQPQFLEQLLENDEPVRISSLSDDQLEAILSERRSQRESAMDSDGGDSDSDSDADTDSDDTADDNNDNEAASPADDDNDNAELPQAPAEDSSDATDTDTDTETEADPSALVDASSSENEATQNEEQGQGHEEEHENEEIPGAMALEANPAAATLLQLKNSVHRRAAREAKKQSYE